MEVDGDDTNCFKYVVIGGGITGVSVVEKVVQSIVHLLSIIITLSDDLQPLHAHKRRIRSCDEAGSILMITESDVVQAASKLNRITLNLEDFIVVEKSFETFKDVDEMLVIVRGRIIGMDPLEHTVLTESGVAYKYDFLCICSGGSPQLISFQQFDGYDFVDHILGIRDTASVAKITQFLSQTKRILLVGNGGIATEFVYEAKNVDIVWSIKDSSIAPHYFDSGAACFLLSSKQYLESCQDSPTVEFDGPTVSKRLKYTTGGILRAEGDSDTATGSALGPDWHNDFLLRGLAGSKTVDIQYGTEVRRLFAPDVHYDLIVTEFGTEEANDARNWRTYVELTNGKRFGVDWILSATGVLPNANAFPGLKDREQGICVNDWMHTSLPDVFAAGDVCFPCWPKQKHWFQMRLWSQGRTMGICAGNSMCIAADPSNSDYERAKRTPSTEELLGKTMAEASRNEMFGGYDIFTHVTKFFGFKVVLLGLYNGQGLPKEDQRIELRYTPNEEYIKVVTAGDRVQGAVLIGDTGLEETFENMILCQLDISKMGTGALLDPNIDLEDYFD